MREFITQVCIQLMNRSLAYTPISKVNGYENLLSYIEVNYIIENSRYLDFTILGREPSEFAAEMLSKRTNLLIALQP